MGLFELFVPVQGLMSLTGPVIEFIKVVQKVDNDNYPEVCVPYEFVGCFVIPRTIVHIYDSDLDAVHIFLVKLIFSEHMIDTSPNVYNQCWSWL